MSTCNDRIKPPKAADYRNSDGDTINFAAWQTAMAGYRSQLTHCQAVEQRRRNRAAQEAAEKAAEKAAAEAREQQRRNRERQRPARVKGHQVTSAARANLNEIREENMGSHPFFGGPIDSPATTKLKARFRTKKEIQDEAFTDAINNGRTVEQASRSALSAWAREQSTQDSHIAASKAIQEGKVTEAQRQYGLALNQKYTVDESGNLTPPEGEYIDVDMYGDLVVKDDNPIASQISMANLKGDKDYEVFEDEADRKFFEDHLELTSRLVDAGREPAPELYPERDGPTRSTQIDIERGELNKLRQEIQEVREPVPKSDERIMAEMKGDTKKINELTSEELDNEIQEQKELIKKLEIQKRRTGRAKAKKYNSDTNEVTDALPLDSPVVSHADRDFASLSDEELTQAFDLAKDDAKRKAKRLNRRKRAKINKELAAAKAKLEKLEQSEGIEAQGGAAFGGDTKRQQDLQDEIAFRNLGSKLSGDGTPYNPEEFNQMSNLNETRRLLQEELDQINDTKTLEGLTETQRGAEILIREDRKKELETSIEDLDENLEEKKDEARITYGEQVRELERLKEGKKILENVFEEIEKEDLAEEALLNKDQLQIKQLEGEKDVLLIEEDIQVAVTEDISLCSLKEVRKKFTNNYPSYIRPTDRLFNQHPHMNLHNKNEFSSSIGFITIQHVPTGIYSVFQAFIKNFRDSYNLKWNEQSAYGRMDPILTYSQTKRTIQLTISIVSDEIVAAYTNMQNLSQVVQSLYPAYDGGGTKFSTTRLAAAPVLKISWGNLINTPVGLRQGVVAAVNNVSIEPQIDKGFFEYGGLSDRDNCKPDFLIPKEISLNLGFTVLHDHSVGWKNTGNPQTADKQNRFYRFPYGFQTHGPAQTTANTDATGGDVSLIDNSDYTASDKKMSRRDQRIVDRLRKTEESMFIQRANVMKNSSKYGKGKEDTIRDLTNKQLNPDANNQRIKIHTAQVIEDTTSGGTTLLRQTN